ncbi:MAG: TonB-dependent receptor [Litorilinea sp.]|nr:MAG: TonB-dependent receptor [Litorilinea sp.]
MHRFIRFSRGCLLGLLVGCLAPVVAWAQTGQVQGHVLDEAALPLAGVNVYVEGTALGAATAADGSFTIAGVPAGEQVLVARMLGFAPARQTVVVPAGAATEVTFTLIEQPIDLDEIVVRRTTLTGGRRGIAGIPGSAHYLSPRELERFSFNDPGRILQTIPGVNVVEEDGYGLRPNIGLRGTGSERSSKITVMEDGVLMAPAPYAAPAAYYFPTVGRMQGIEVRKGSSQIKYGPYTTGGALNLISTAIPETFSGKIDVLAGEDDERTVHAYIGDSYQNFGFLAETYQGRSDGFKELDGGGPTGFDKKDYLAKLRINTNPDAAVYQALTFKAGQTTETSDETYLGLTDADFARNPFRRYAGSQQDEMNTEHEQYMLRHVIRPARGVDVTTTLYRTDFHRNWYKLDRVRASADGERVKIGALLADPESYAAEYAIVTGATSPNDNALEVKANNRTYYARGAESIVGLQFGDEKLSHELELGFRLHEDQIDRFQWVDLYRMVDGVMELTQAGTPGTESNRVETATATAAYVQYRLEAGRLTVIPGLRFEHIRIRREDYGKNDPARTGADLKTRENTVDVLIPGLGVDYALTPRLNAFVGVHKGFAPPGSTPGADPEESINYEAGARYHSAGFKAEGVFFFNDYSNLLGADLAASGGTGTADQFNGGAVHALGVELAAGYDLGLALKTRLSLPLTVSYTYTKATFQNAFESDFEPWGTVEKGDELPYLPHHQLALGLGLEHGRLGVHLNGRYVSRMRTEAGQGDYLERESVDPHFVVDASADYRLSLNVKLFASVRNLTDASYIVARRPAGVRPGLPQTFLFGVKTLF